MKTSPQILIYFLCENFSPFRRRGGLRRKKSPPLKVKVLSSPPPSFWKFGWRFNPPSRQGEGGCTLWFHCNIDTLRKQKLSLPSCSSVFIRQLHKHKSLHQQEGRATPMYTQSNILDILVGSFFQSLPSYFDIEKWT